jgi:hypothetical protein
MEAIAPPGGSVRKSLDRFDSARQRCAVPDRSPKRPPDSNKPGNPRDDGATPDGQHLRRDVPKNAAAVELGRLGGLKGGKARAASLTPERRAEIARAAAAARWGTREPRAG